MIVELPLKRPGLHPKLVPKVFGVPPVHDREAAPFDARPLLHSGEQVQERHRVPHRGLQTRSEALRGLADLGGSLNKDAYLSS